MDISVMWLLSFQGLLLMSNVVDGSDDVEDTVEVKKDIPYTTPYEFGANKETVFLDESMDSDDLITTKWIISEAKKQEGPANELKYDGKWVIKGAKKHPLVGDKGLLLSSQAKHSAISCPLKKAFDFTQNDVLVVQYEINFQNGLDCGGGYIKLLSSGSKLSELTDTTPYTIMFGPDKCGDSKFHFILKYKNPKSGEIEEKHVKKLATKERVILDSIFKDNKPHLLKLVLKSDNTYQIVLDNENILLDGSLLEDFTPPINPPADIEDPDDKKPIDWEDQPKIVDPNSVKPSDWDEDAPPTIPDPDAVKPEDWDESQPEHVIDTSAEKPDDWDVEMDGEWEAPLKPNPKCGKDSNTGKIVGCGEWRPSLVRNPDYKGKWSPSMIDNPAYKGVWKARMIPNPNFYYDANPYAKFSSIDALALELWSMSDDIYFDNFIVTSDIDSVEEWTEQTFTLKKAKWDLEEGGISGNFTGGVKAIWRRIVTFSNENPWIYAVYVIVVILPLVLLITFCCGNGDKDNASAKRGTEVHHKKTDLGNEEQIVLNSSAVNSDEEISPSRVNGATDEDEPEELKVEESEENPTEEDKPMTRRRKARKD